MVVSPKQNVRIYEKNKHIARIYLPSKK